MCATTELKNDNWSKVSREKLYAKKLVCKFIYQEEKIDFECDPSSGESNNFLNVNSLLTVHLFLELVFKGDFAHQRSNVLTIKNKSQRSLLFKIKTTKPEGSGYEFII